MTEVTTRQIFQLDELADLQPTDLIAVQRGEAPAHSGRVSALEAYLVARGFGPTIVRETRTELDAVTPATEQARGEVRNDPAGDIEDANGIYAWVDPDWVWVGPLDTPTVAAMRAAFVPVTSSNLADPSVLPAGVASRAEIVNRTFNLTTGALNAQSAVTFSTWLAYLGPALEGGGTYTILLDACPLGAYFDIALRLPFYSEAGAFLSSEAVGFTLSADKRKLTVTVPGVGLKRPGLNIRDVTLFNADTPMDLAYANLFFDRLMLVEGPDRVPFETWTEPGSLAPDPDLFHLNDGRAGTLIREGVYTYIRAPKQLSPDKHIVRRLLTGEVPAYNPTGAHKPGTVDFVGARTIPADTPLSGTIAAFNTSTLIDSGGTDERTPLKVNAQYVSGAHTLVAQRGTKVGHGLTAANEGATATDGIGASWVLAKVVSTSIAVWAPDNVGTDEKWSMSTNAPSGSTLTWASGGADFGALTGWTWAAGFIPSLHRDLVIETFVDGEPVTADGTYPYSKARINQTVVVQNAAQTIDYQQAHPGATDWNNTDIPIQIERQQTFEFDDLGALVIHDTEYAAQSWARFVSVPGDYSGIMQWQRPARTIDSTPGLATKILVYVPDMAPVDGYDVKAIANVTALAAQLALPNAGAADPDDPPSHYLMIGRDAGDAQVTAFVCGYSRVLGQTMPAKLKVSTAYRALISVALKLYPIAVDWTVGDAVAGQNRTTVAWHSFFDQTDPDLTIPGVCHEENGRLYAVVTSHQALGDKWVALPAKAIGRPVSICKPDVAGSVTLKSDAVSRRGVLLNFAAAYGDVVLEIG